MYYHVQYLFYLLKSESGWLQMGCGGHEFYFQLIGLFDLNPKSD
jgi:hypothetical protein